MLPDYIRQLPQVRSELDLASKWGVLTVEDIVEDFYREVDGYLDFYLTLNYPESFSN